jgi:hypothetical protein
VPDHHLLPELGYSYIIGSFGAADLMQLSARKPNRGG